MSYNIIILVKNEGAIISDAVEDCLRFTDSIHVVDSGSVDNTVELVSAQELVQMYVNIQLGKFQISDQRNWALKNCKLKYDWSFFLDADERMTKLLDLEIKSFIMQNIHDGALVRPLNYLYTVPLKHTFGRNNWHARLVKGVENSFQGGVWENFNNEIVVGKLKHKYDHYFISKGLHDWIVKHDRYSDEESNLYFEFNPLTNKPKLRKFLNIFYFFRPFFRFFKFYIFNGGFRDGKYGLFYCCMLAWYECLVVIKIINLKIIKSVALKNR